MPIPELTTAPSHRKQLRRHKPDVDAEGQSRLWPATKRAVDIVGSLIATLALLPLLIVLALAVKLDSPGPVLFYQKRYGRDMRLFTVLKFRTMHSGVSAEAHREYIAHLVAGGAEQSSGLKKLQDDSRVTRVGRILRRFSLDELPQFLNVLSGSMSLVGPRPAIDYELEHYEPHHLYRFHVRPGMTGLWQVSGRNDLGFTEMLDLDAEYARAPSFATDLRVLLRTPRTVLRGAA